jgi:hypothetical protein
MVGFKFPELVVKGGWVIVLKLFCVTFPNSLSKNSMNASNMIAYFK